MSDAPPPTAVPAHPETLDEDIPCISCGYNLRGLYPDGRCPECGIPIERSMREDLLKLCDPTWVDRLRSGATWAYWGLIATVLTLILGTVAAAAVGAFAAFGGAPGAPPPAPGSFPLLTTTITVAQWVFMGMMLLGVWKLTSPSPAEAHQTEMARARKGCRFAVAVVLVAAVCSQAIQPLAIGSHNALLVIGGIFGLINVVFFFVGTHYFFSLMRYLAARVPSDPIAKATRRGGRRLKAFLVLAGLAIVCQILVIIAIFGSTTTTALTAGAPLLVPPATTLPTPNGPPLPPALFGQPNAPAAGPTATAPGTQVAAAPPAAPFPAPTTPRGMTALGIFSIGGGCLAFVAGLAFLLVAAAVEDTLRKARREFNTALQEARVSWESDVPVGG